MVGDKKIMKYLNKLISVFKTRHEKKNNEKENIEHQDLQSDELERKLALLIKNIDGVDQEDLKQVEYKKLNKEISNDLFTSYRLDFHTRDELNKFKKKYSSLLL